MHGITNCPPVEVSLPSLQCNDINEGMCSLLILRENALLGAKYSMKKENWTQNSDIYPIRKLGNSQSGLDPAYSI